MNTVHLDNKMASLFEAARTGKTNTVKLLLEYGIDVDSDIVYVNKNGNTALNIAALHGHTHIISLLLDKGAFVDHVNNNGNTALIYASWEGHLETVRFLLEKCVNVHQKNNHKHTALITARLEGHEEVAQLLMCRMVYNKIKLRRAIQARVIGTFASFTDFEKPGTNTFFYNMGIGLKTSCSFEELQESFPDITQQNYHFFIEGCK